MALVQVRGVVWCSIELDGARVLSLLAQSGVRYARGVTMVLYEYEVQPHARFYECHEVEEPRTPIIVDHSMMHREPVLNIGIVNSSGY